MGFYPPKFPLRSEGQLSLAQRVPCRQCGYDLRGLSAAARCPECGLSVSVSTSADPFWQCDPAWLRRVALGLLIAAAGMAAATCAMLVEMTAARPEASWRLAAPTPESTACWVIVGIGTCVATQTSGVSGVRGHRSYRAMAWASAAAAAASWPLVYFVDGPALSSAYCAVFVHWAASLAVAGVMLGWVRSLARAMCRADLGRAAMAMWILGIFLLASPLALPVFLICDYLLGLGLATPDGTVRGLVIVLNLAYVVWLVSCTLFLLKMRAELRLCASMRLLR